MSVTLISLGRALSAPLTRHLLTALVLAVLALGSTPAGAQNAESPEPATEIIPDDPEALAGSTPIAMVEQAYVAHRKGNYDEAISGYSKIIQRRGLTRRERAIAYLLRGEAKHDAGRLDDAILDFNRSLDQWPGYPQAHFFRGRVYEEQGNLAQAYEDIAQAAEMEPQRESYNTRLTLLKKRMEEAELDRLYAPAEKDAEAPAEGP